jgi:hypothetical protein
MEEPMTTQDSDQTVPKNELLELPTTDEEQTTKRTRKKSVQLSSDASLINPEKAKRERKGSLELSSNKDYLLFANKVEKKKERKESVQGSTLEDILCCLTDLEKEPNQEKSVVELERYIVQQVQEHINYFRLVFRIYRKIKDLLKTNDKGIKSFKNHLLHLYGESLKESE